MQLETITIAPIRVARKTNKATTDTTIMTTTSDTTTTIFVGK